MHLIIIINIRPSNGSRSDSEYSYSIKKYLDVVIGHGLPDHVQTIFQFLKIQVPIFIGVHHLEHLFDPIYLVVG